MHTRTLTIASDTLTPISAYRALAERGEACLLESVESGGRISRYSFIGLNYLDAQSFEESGGLIHAVRSFVSSYRDRLPGAETFAGALVVFSYDAARPFARLWEGKAAHPPMPAAYVAIPGTWLIFDHFSDMLTIWACANSAAEAQKTVDRYAQRLLAAQPSLPGAVRITSEQSASMTREQFVNKTLRVKEYITDGEVYQLQLGIRFTAQIEGSPLDFYRALRSENPSPYMFFVDAPFGEIFGASPEFLVRLEGRTARIRPLAGTRPRGTSEAQDAAIAAELLSNEKERAEHVMLVDLGRNDLGVVCEYGSVQAGELLQIEKYSHVIHIVSDLFGTLRPECDALDLFSAGFPAGTVTGTPKIRAMQLIDELEPVARGFYAGSVGRWSFGGDFDSCITLRSVHIREGLAAWQASAGIVADSDPEAEYAEVLQKTGIIRKVLGR